MRKILTRDSLLGKIIDLMRKEGVKVDSPYDFENWFEDNANHTELFKTGKFKQDEE